MTIQILALLLYNLPITKTQRHQLTWCTVYGHAAKKNYSTRNTIIMKRLKMCAAHYKIKLPEIPR